MDRSTAFIAIWVLLVIAAGLFVLSARNFSKAKHLQAGVSAHLDSPAPPAASERPRARRITTAGRSPAAPMMTSASETSHTSPGQVGHGESDRLATDEGGKT